MAFALQEALARRVKPLYGLGCVFCLALTTIGLGSRAGLILFGLFILSCAWAAKRRTKIIAVAVVLEVIWISRHVLTWVIISVFLALALNPAVEWFQSHGLKRRGAAAAVTFLLAIAFIVAIGFTFVPTLVSQVNDFVHKLPDYVDDITKGRGRLGFLETKYHLQERIRDAVSESGATRVLGLSGVAINVAKGVITIVVATVTIIFMTFFMP